MTATMSDTTIEIQATRIQQQDDEIARLKGLLSSSQDMLAAELLATEKARDEWIGRAQAAELDAANLRELLADRTKYVEEGLIPTINQHLATIKRLETELDARTQEHKRIAGSAESRIQRLEFMLNEQKQRNVDLNGWCDRMRTERDQVAQQVNRLVRVQGHLVGALGECSQAIEPVRTVSLTIAEAKDLERQQNGDEVPF